MRNEMNIDRSLCDVCGTCASVCPVSAIRIKEFEVIFLEEICIHCGNCIQVCPIQAISEEK
jgi:ferredoxin